MGRSDETRSRLVESARDQVVALGWQGASSRAITSAAGLPLGAINYHFGNREALLAEACLLEVQEMFRTPYELIMAAASVDDLLDALLSWVARRDSTDRQHALLLEVMSQSRRDPAVAEALGAALTGFRTVVADAVARVTSCADADAGVLASALVAQANGLWLRAAVEETAQPDPGIDRALETWRRALLPRVGPT